MKRTQLERIAQIAHEINRTLAALNGDMNHKPWAEASDHIRASAIHGVRTAIGKPRLTPKGIHNEWCQYKYENGWQYGPVKDEAAKTHPCLQEFENLPPEEQLKDAVFLTIVRTLAKVKTP